MLTSSVQKPVLPSFTLEQIKNMLEEDIALGYLHPKQRLVEDELIERFNTKRHIVRQALLELETSGLVERKRNIGAFVKEYSIKEVTDLYVVRILLETSAVDHMDLPASTEHIEALVHIQKQHDIAAQKGDLRQAFRLNVTFHQVFFSISDNEVLQQSINELAQRAHLVRSLSITHPTYLEKARTDHWQLIKLLQSTDRESLKKLCKGHLTPSRDAYIEQYKRRAGVLAHESTLSTDWHLS